MLYIEHVMNGALYLKIKLCCPHCQLEINNKKVREQVKSKLCFDPALKSLSDRGGKTIDIDGRSQNLHHLDSGMEAQIGGLRIFL